MLSIKNMTIQIRHPILTDFSYYFHRGNLYGILLPAVLAPVSAVAHLIPTTYVRSFDITTGVFQHAIENYQVTTGLGVLVLTISTLLLVAIIFALQGRGKRLIIEKRQPAPTPPPTKTQKLFHSLD